MRSERPELAACGSASIAATGCEAAVVVAMAPGGIGPAGARWARVRELIGRAGAVEAAMANLPAGALRGKRSRNIRRNLAVLTNGRVGGLRFKVHDEEAAKQRALKSLKQVTRLIAREALKVGSDPVAQESDKAAWRQFQKALEFLLSLWSS